MTYLKMLILMLVMNLTFVGCKKDMDTILTRKDGTWLVTDNTPGSKSSKWTFEKDGKVYFGDVKDNTTAMEWYYNEYSSEMLFSMFSKANPIDNNTLKYKVVKATNNEQEWVWAQGQPYQIIYKLKRLK